jgi:hypothetical protein
MSTLGQDIGYSDKWNPETIDLKVVQDILKEVGLRHDVSEPELADSLSKRLLIVADHLASDLTRLKLYYTAVRSKAKDRFNDVKQAAIDEKSDAGKERIALCDEKFRELRDEYKKAELLVGHLEIKYRELISYHYSFKDTARRLSGIRSATNGGSDTDRNDPFEIGNLPLNTDPATEAKKDEETF